MPFLGFLNPYTWAALGIALMLGFSSGYGLGWGHSNASYWRGVAKQKAEAAETKERLAKLDAERAALAEAQRDDLQVRLDEVIHASESDKGACQLSPAELKRLQQLAGYNGRNK